MRLVRVEKRVMTGPPDFAYVNPQYVVSVEPSWSSSDGGPRMAGSVVRLIDHGYVGAKLLPDELVKQLEQTKGLQDEKVQS